ncbi:hypothetical protein Tco_0665433 [Tanacetum coccineum]
MNKRIYIPKPVGITSHEGQIYAKNRGSGYHHSEAFRESSREHLNKAMYSEAFKSTSETRASPDDIKTSVAKGGVGATVGSTDVSGVTSGCDEALV